MLKHVTRPTSEPITKDKLAAYAGLLAEEFGAEAFTPESLKLVGDGHEFFPAYATVRTALIGYLAQRRYLALPSQVPNSLQDRIDELRDNGAYFRRIADERAQARADWSDPAKVRASVRKIGDDHPMRDMLRSLLAGLVKKHAPENLDQIPPGWQAGAIVEHLTTVNFKGVSPPMGIRALDELTGTIDGAAEETRFIEMQS